MKISVERNDLFKAMGRAQSIVERRTTIPILSNVFRGQRKFHQFESYRSGH